MGILSHWWIFLIYPVFLVGILAFAYAAGWALRKGWDRAAPKPTGDPHH